MPDAAIALGSNLGDRAANLHQAVKRIESLGQVTRVASFVQTAPVGYVDQPDFLNSALLLQTDLPPETLMQALLAIEQSLGRLRLADAPAKGPRLIDLDLLLYDSLILNTAGLRLPHPEMHRRAFVLAPLAEIAPNWPHPVLGRPIATLLEESGSPELQPWLVP